MTDSYELELNTREHKLARNMLTTWRGYESDLADLQKQIEEIQEQRYKEFRENIAMIMKELKIEGDPAEWTLDVRYLDEHSRAFLIKREPFILSRSEEISEKPDTDRMN